MLHVLICGLPSSGNNLLRRYVRELADEAHAAIDIAHESHQVEAAMTVAWRHSRRVLAIRIRRDERYRLASWARRSKPMWIKSHQDCSGYEQGVDDALGDTPIIEIQYEDIVANPEAQGRRIAVHLGFAYKDWTNVIDGNEKYEELVRTA